MTAILFPSDPDLGSVALRKEFGLPRNTQTENYRDDQESQDYLHKRLTGLRNQNFHTALFIGEGRNRDNTRNGTNALAFWKDEAPIPLTNK